MTVERFVKQLDGCTLCGGKSMGGLNCTCAAEAMWLYRASQGSISTTACHVRDLTNDCDGGTNLEQMAAVSAHYGITSGKVYRPMSFSSFETAMRSGRYGAIIQVNYAPIRGTQFDCFGGGFHDGHGMYASRGNSLTCHYADPGADGRRAGIPDGYQNMPWSLLERAAGELDIGGRQLGLGKIYAYLTPPDPVTPTQEYIVTISGRVTLYNHPGGTKVGAVTQATYRCARSKVNGAWWYRIISKASGGSTANAGRYFQPNRYVSARSV